MDFSRDDTMTITVPAPPRGAYVDVDFYDADERESLLQSAHGSAFDGIPVRLNLSTVEVCAYYNLGKLHPVSSGRSYRLQLSGMWRHAIVKMSGQINFENDSMQLVNVGGTDGGVIEHLGEAVGLCVADKIHGLHQADWRRIPHTADHKILDFEYRASDGSTLITIETKGAGATNNGQKPSNVSGHKADIKKKKSAPANAAARAGICYGTIAVLSDAPDSVARCWLVDPPVTSVDDPFRFKLLARLEFIAEWMGILSPRSALGAALRTRIAALRKVEPVGALSRVALCKADGEEFAKTVFSGGGSKRNPFFAAQSLVSGHAIGGAVSVISLKQMLFLGIREELVAYAAGQDFEVINRYGFGPEVVGATLECCIPQARFNKEFSPRFQIPGAIKSGGYWRFPMEGKFYQTRSGLVFGILPIPDSWVANPG